MDSKMSDPFSSEAEELPAARIISRFFPKGISGSTAKEWLDRRRKSIRPWASFVDQRKFSKPKNFGELCQRVVKNLDTYHSNYTFIFLGLILYCIISSPMLLIALAVFVGAFYIIHLKSLESKLVIFGRELNQGHQLGLAGSVSLPVFWLAGAGAAVFWVMGATLAVIGSHAAFHELESSDMEDLLMEPVDETRNEACIVLLQFVFLSILTVRLTSLTFQASSPAWQWSNFSGCHNDDLGD